jgi:hypothetical protein
MPSEGHGCSRGDHRIGRDGPTVHRVELSGRTSVRLFPTLAGSKAYPAWTHLASNVSSPALPKLHDHTLPIGSHDHSLLIGNFNFILALFLLDFFWEPFFHEAIALASSISLSDRRTLKQPDRESLISA